MAPTLTYDGTYIKLEWTPPTANHATIDMYEVEIEHSDGSFAEVTSLCDGTDATNLANSFCLVPLHLLRQAPTSLPFFWDEATITRVDSNSVQPIQTGERWLIRARLRAHNERGWGDMSTINYGTSPLV